MGSGRKLFQLNVLGRDCVASSLQKLAMPINSGERESDTGNASTLLSHLQKYKPDSFMKVTSSAPFRAVYHLFSVLATGAALTALSARAQVFQLVINDSNPALVSITATEEFSTADASNGSGQGVVLAGFFQAPQIGVAFSVVGTFLKAPGSNFLDAVNSFNIGGGQVDLELSRGGVTPLGEVFSTVSPAFQGGMFVDMSSSAATLPPPGSTGSIVAFNFGSNPVIGQWIIVPEPGACAAVTGLGLVGFALWRRHKS